ncbi:MAG: CBS domain-containing protein [Alphaproteobacteria bacterium]|nr:CBS domain-containing protein [Alphaproteobacteria bacterium]
MKVRQYMSSTVIAANLQDGLHQTWERMRERGVRHMPVLDDHEKLVGIISDRDVRRPDTVDLGQHVDAFVLDDQTKVHQAMTGGPATVHADDDVADALGEFVEHKYGALPVVDDAGRVVGMLSAYDLLAAFQDSLRA